MTRRAGRADEASPHGRAGTRAARDAIAAAVVVIGGGFAVVSTDAFERTAATLLHFERLELDDLLLTSFLAVAAASWFALRRWLDSARQLRALRRSERENARSLRRLEELSAQLSQTEEHERARLAQLLHDEIGQTLFACRLKLDALAPLLHDERAVALVDEARALAGGAMEQARTLTAELNPPVLEDLGLAPAIEWLLGRLEQRHDTKARCVPGAAWSLVPRSSQAAVFHSVKELVVNACKHAGASSVSVSAQIHGEREVRVCVRDDGSGFDPGAHGDGFGLFSVERRIAWLHGRLEIDSAPARGTAAFLHLPCSADGDGADPAGPVVNGLSAEARR